MWWVEWREMIWVKKETHILNQTNKQTNFVIGGVLGFFFFFYNCCVTSRPIFSIQLFGLKYSLCCRVLPTVLLEIPRMAREDKFHASFAISTPKAYTGRL
jgi:hypothetical protein